MPLKDLSMEANINFRLLRQLGMFAVVAQERNFSRAARKMNMSQPPLTEQIKQLEEHLGAVLFERTSRGSELTAAGAAILPAVKQVADQVFWLEQIVRDLACNPAGMLHVGCVSTTMLTRAPDMLEAIQAANPRLTIKTCEKGSLDALADLKAGQLDLAFVRSCTGDLSGIRIVPLHTDQLAVALPHSHPLAAMGSVTLRSLQSECFVMLRREANSAYHDTIMQACTEHGLIPRGLHEVNSSNSLIAYVGCRQGVALVPLTMRHVAPQNVVVLPLAENIPLATVSVAWNESRQLPIFKQVRQWLETEGLLAPD